VGQFRGSCTPVELTAEEEGIARSRGVAVFADRLILEGDPARLELAERLRAVADHLDQRFKSRW
jgi:hypothetical protein